MTRTVYVVLDGAAFVGQRYYNGARNTHDFVPFKHARLFLRKQDAAQYPGEIVECTVSVK